jgi:hypothetical protein
VTTSTSSTSDSGKEILASATGEYIVSTWDIDGGSLNNDYNITGVIGALVSDLLTADIDGDGDTETIVATKEGSEPRIQIYEYQLGEMVPEHTLNHPYLTTTGGDAGPVQSVAVGDLDNDGSPVLEMVSCIDFGKTATVWNKGATTWEPVLNVPTFGLCDSVAAGDIDDDGDVEFVVNGGYGGWCHIFLYEYQGGTWTNTANYTSFQECSREVEHMEIKDADNDNDNELVVAYGLEPMQILELSGGQLTNVWTATFDPVNPYTFSVGDVTNDGENDIVVYESFSDTVRIFETVNGTIINTFNIYESGMPAADGDSIAIGDIDDDNNNEFAIVGMGSDMYVFRNNALIYKRNLGYAESIAVEIGDYDNDAAPATSAGSLSFDDIISADNLQSATLTSQSADDFSMEILTGAANSVTEQNVTMVWEYGATWANTYNVTMLDISAYDIVVEDIDSDGDQETVIGGSRYTAGFEDYPAHTMVYENEGGELVSVYNLDGPDPSDTGEVLDVEVADINNDGDPYQEIITCYGPRGDISVQIWDYTGSGYTPIFSITNVIAHNSGCEGIAVGNLDGDSDLELAVTEEMVTPYRAMIRIFEHQSGTWENTANYTFVNPQDCHFYGFEIADINNDGTDNVIAFQGWNGPLVFEYTGSTLDLIYNMTNNPYGILVSGNAQKAFLVGDVTNDNKADIVIPEFTTNVMMVFENVSGGIVNTFNVSVDLGNTQPTTDIRNSFAIGDIDNDGLNEYIYTGSTAKKLFVFKDDTMLSSHDLPTSESSAAAIGDYDNDAATDFRVDITINSQEADYLVYKLSDFGAANDVYFPVAGVLNTVSDDQYRTGTNGGYITSLTQNTWTDFSLSGADAYVCTYDGQTSDVIGFAKGLDSSGVSIEKLSVWNEGGSSEAMRIKYDLSSAESSDYAEFLFAFSQGDYTTIENHMGEISVGNYPTSLYNFQ